MFQIDHLGIAVKSLAAAKSIYEKLGLSISPEETVEAEKVRVAMVPVGESRLELLEATADDSTIARFIAKHGEGLHHVCLRVPDLAAAVARLKSDGVRLVSNEIKTGAGGHRYVFVHPQSAAGCCSSWWKAAINYSLMLLLAVDTSGRNGSLALARVATGPERNRRA